MLNSTSSRHPAGLANSSGVLGHYLMDHVMGGGAAATLPVLRGIPDTRGNRPNGMADTATEMLEAAGAEAITREEDMSPPGLAIHEVGTARMGNDPAASVLNRWQQAHEVANLFVMDGSCYVSSACQNPTLTMMALAARACDYLVEEFRAGRV